MIQYKVKAKNKYGTAFPVSAYVLRSYSSEPSDQCRQHCKPPDPEMQKEEQEFYGLIKGWRLERQIISEPIRKSLRQPPKDLIPQIKSRAEDYPNSTHQNLYRTRQKKQSIITKAEIDPVKETQISPTKKMQMSIMKKTQINIGKKIQMTQNKSIQAFYRYQTISLFSCLNRKEDYINSLKAKKDLMANPMKSKQLQDKLTKLLESKGRDRGRQKFNQLTNQQLRSLKYKPKISITNNHSCSKKSKNFQTDDWSELSDNEQVKQDKIDLQTWKRRNGISFYKKVFIIKGGYHQLRKALLDRGWYENQDVNSQHFDFKWTTRICDINYLKLKNYQAVNHFNNNYHLTSKYGLTRRLRTLILGHGIDVDRFYPRCYDLGDQVDLENFVENFKFGFAETVARRFLVDQKRYHALQLKIRITVNILKRRTQSFHHLINEINKGIFPAITPEEWEILTETTELGQKQQEDKLKEWRKKENFGLEMSYDSPQYEQNLYNILEQKVQGYLLHLKKRDPQIDINGYRNVWIVKPNFMSRGRGIRCFNNLYDIADYCLGRDVQFVAQKYIEHPLVIEGKKFDIRQWVLIQDFNPPKIWFYKQSYVRFCGDEFSLENIYNRQIHLTNNSVQKYNKKHDVSNSTWPVSELEEHVGAQAWESISQKIKNIVVWSIKSCEGYVLGRRGSCELVGYDFMIDESLNPWLIEINMSPSMEYSTPVTKQLVKSVLQDAAKILSPSRNKRDTGSFECIYQDEQDLSKFDVYKL